MPTVYLGLGSNLGDREGHLADALERLAERVEVREVSPVYESEPAGYHDQPRFLNLVARVDTGLGPAALLEHIHDLERGMGRERVFRDAPRIIDIDILLYDDIRMSTESLTLPHPRMLRREFVLRPLADLDPGLELDAGPVHALLQADDLVGATEPYRPRARLARWTGSRGTDCA